MDLAVYINELLGLKGEVNVPGIGHFAHVRISGYYNENENKFYPPSHKIDFDPKYKSDESLASYISDKKNISLASSKYFIEKYVNGIKQQVALNKVDIAGLGNLYLDGSTIGFSEDALSKENDPAFFGLKPIEIQEILDKPAVKYASPPVVQKEEGMVTPPPVTEPLEMELVNDRVPPPPPKPTVIEEAEVQDEPEYEYEEPVTRNNNNTWIAILLILIIALLALLGLYKYKPEWFDRSKEKPQTFVAVDTTAEQPAEKKVNNTDTTKKIAIATKEDSMPKVQALVTGKANNANTVDTAAVLHYEILGGAFKSSVQANNILKRYQDMGLKARILKHIEGKSYIITLGTYFDKNVADKAMDSILSVTKIKKGEILVQTYKPKR
jgi:cell division protein FtsN